MNFLKRLCCKHKLTEIRARTIEINGPESEGKRNHAAQEFWEVRKICRNCDYLVSEGYFSTDELKKGT